MVSPEMLVDSLTVKGDGAMVSVVSGNPLQVIGLDYICYINLRSQLKNIVDDEI